MAEGGLHVQGFAALMDKRADEGVPAEEEHSPEAQHRRKADIELGAEGIRHAPVVPAAVELGGEDARARKPAEDAEVEDEEELVDDGDAGHGLRPHLSDHDVVQEVYKIRDEVLDQNGDHDREEPPVKGPVAEILLKPHVCHCFPSFPSSFVRGGWR